MSPTTAYDYDKQCWVTGIAAKPLLIAQLRDSLDLLTGPRASEYAHTIKGQDLPSLVSAVRRQLAGLGVAS